MSTGTNARPAASIDALVMLSTSVRRMTHDAANIACGEAPAERWRFHDTCGKTAHAIRFETAATPTDSEFEAFFRTTRA
ncbi:hypothetical protein [Burkholderia catarinensis]|uniref:hypothetical protein n=1 Tax=Burkholderia catarinensis TaxID=1108140 RepID=UPI0009158130|nr:hypothetical protein [Burkholderia catarinensis]